MSFLRWLYGRRNQGNQKSDGKAVVSVDSQKAATAQPRWTKLPQDNWSVFACRGSFPATSHLEHVIRITHLRQVGHLQPYVSSPDVTHHLWVHYRDTRLHDPPLRTLISQQFGFSAIRRLGLSSDDVARRVCIVLLKRVIDAPDSDIFYFQYSQLKREERLFGESRNAWWAYQVSKAHDIVLKELNQPAK